MSLLEALKTDPALAHCLIDKCEENELCVVFDDLVHLEDYVIIKVDEYYRVQTDYIDPVTKANRTPPSIDCLIILGCKERNRYRLLLVEQKNTDDNPNKANIKGKFETTLHDFMAGRFGKYFYNTEYEFEIGLYLQIFKVSAAKIVRSISKEYLMRLEHIPFGGRRYRFEFLPPVIHPC